MHRGIWRLPKICSVSFVACTALWAEEDENFSWMKAFMDFQGSMQNVCHSLLTSFVKECSFAGFCAGVLKVDVSVPLKELFNSDSEQWMLDRKYFHNFYVVFTYLCVWGQQHCMYKGFGADEMNSRSSSGRLKYIEDISRVEGYLISGWFG